MKRYKLCTVLCAAFLLFSFFVRAEMDMGQEKKGPSTTAMTPKTAFFKEIVIEGVRTKFEVMTMEEHKKMLKEMKVSLETADKSATHHVSVTLYDEKSGKEVANAAVNMKVVSPGKKEQVKMLTFMPEMKHYGNDFTLSEKGKYEILTLFKIGEQKRKGGFYYEVK
jgi:hypothetical protein